MAREFSDFLATWNPFQWEQEFCLRQEKIAEQIETIHDKVRQPIISRLIPAQINLTSINSNVQEFVLGKLLGLESNVERIHRRIQDHIIVGYGPIYANLFEINGNVNLAIGMEGTHHEKSEEGITRKENETSDTKHTETMQNEQIVQIMVNETKQESTPKSVMVPILSGTRDKTTPIVLTVEMVQAMIEEAIGKLGSEQGIKPISKGSSFPEKLKEENKPKGQYEIDSCERGEDLRWSISPCGLSTLAEFLYNAGIPIDFDTKDSVFEALDKRLTIEVR